MAKSSEILIIGGGIIGLAIAIEFKLRGATVTVLNRNFQEAATHVAAGMLAPQAEGLPPGPMLDLALQSRSCYGDWTRKLEEITGLETGYWPCGILAPVYEQPDITELPQTPETPAIWLDKNAIAQHQPNLGQDIAGGWWYPQDGQVDNRRYLAKALKMAASELGVNLQEGIEVEEICSQNQQVTGIQTSTDQFTAEHYILATGAWSGQLLPIPVSPRKGQMLSVRVPNSVETLHETSPDETSLDETSAHETPLKQVLFGPEIYIVPRRDGLIVIGATSEDTGFTPGLTPAGIHTLLSKAIRIYPPLQDFPIQEFWWGYRPATPDELPILGKSPFSNLTFAVGHYRNGILLAPITAKLITDLVWENRSNLLLKYFSYQRFNLPKN